MNPSDDRGRTESGARRFSVLYLVATADDTGLTGGGRHEAGVRRHLGQHHDVTVLAVDRLSSADPFFPERAGVDCLRGGVWSYCRRYRYGMEREVARVIREGAFDLVWADSYDCAPYLRRCGDVPSILMTRDSLTRYYHTLNAIKPTFLSRLAEKRMRWFESRFYQAATRVVFLSEVDAEFHRLMTRRNNGAVTLQGIEVGERAGEVERNRGEIVFTGAMDYAPNADAAQWFACEVMPLITREEPDTRFIVAGHSPDRATLVLDKRPDTTVTGFVEDMADVVRRASVVVSPLRFGSGVKTKVLEAMALGTPVVASPLSMDGIDMRGGRDFLVAETPIEFAECVLGVLRDPACGAAMADRAGMAVSARYSWLAHTASLDQLIADVVGR